MGVASSRLRSTHVIHVIRAFMIPAVANGTEKARFLTYLFDDSKVISVRKTAVGKSGVSPRAATG